MFQICSHSAKFFSNTEIMKTFICTPLPTLGGYLADQYNTLEATNCSLGTLPASASLQIEPGHELPAHQTIIAWPFLSLAFIALSLNILVEAGKTLELKNGSFFRSFNMGHDERATVGVRVYWRSQGPLVKVRATVEVRVCCRMQGPLRCRSQSLMSNVGSTPLLKLGSTVEGRALCRSQDLLFKLLSIVEVRTTVKVRLHC